MLTIHESWGEVYYSMPMLACLQQQLFDKYIGLSLLHGSRPFAMATVLVFV